METLKEAITGYLTQKKSRGLETKTIAITDALEGKVFVSTKAQESNK